MKKRKLLVLMVLITAVSVAVFFAACGNGNGGNGGGGSNGGGGTGGGVAVPEIVANPPATADAAEAVLEEAGWEVYSWDIHEYYDWCDETNEPIFGPVIGTMIRAQRGYFECDIVEFEPARVIYREIFLVAYMFTEANAIETYTEWRQYQDSDDFVEDQEEMKAVGITQTIETRRIGNIVTQWNRIEGPVSGFDIF